MCFGFGRFAGFVADAAAGADGEAVAGEAVFACFFGVGVGVEVADECGHEAEREAQAQGCGQQEPAEDERGEHDAAAGAVAPEPASVGEVVQYPGVVFLGQSSAERVPEPVEGAGSCHGVHGLDSTLMISTLTM